MADEDQPSADVEPNEDEVADPEPPPPFTLTVSVKVRVARALAPVPPPVQRSGFGASRGRRLIPPPPLPPAQSLTRLVADSPPPEVPDGEDPPEPSPPEPVRVEFLFPGEEAPTSFDPAVPSDDGSVVFDGVEASFEREPGAALVTQLVNNPLVITVHRGETKLATCTVDLTPFAAGASVAGGEAHPLAPVPFPVADPPADGEDPPEPLPVNPLLPDATKHVTVAPSETFVSPEDAEGGRVMTFAATRVFPVPATLVEVSAAHGDVSPFAFTVGFPLDGVEPALCAGGVLAVVPQPDPEPVEDGVEPPEPPPPSYEIRWPASAATKVWMPKRTVDALVSRVKRRGRASPWRLGATAPPRAARAIPCTPTTTQRAPPRWTVCWTRVASSSRRPRRFTRPRTAISRAFPSPRARTREAGDGGGGSARGGVGAAAEGSATLDFAVTMSDPLVPEWRPPPPTEVTVADLLPHREPVEPHVPKDEAAERYRTEVLSAASTLSKEYAAMFTGEPGDAEGKDARRKALVFELNRSGKYHDLKERLKEAAQGIIKERFFQGGESAREKYNELYVHLVEEMHASLRTLGAAREPSRVALVDPVDRERLAECKALADEYEIDDEHDSADKWHQERLLVTRDEPEVWTDYGAFLSRRGRWGKAEEAFKEALVLDERYVPALRALAALMLRDEEHHRAEVYAQGITASASPGDPIAWSLLATTYARADRETDAVNCEFEARRLAAGVMNNLLGSPGATATRADPDAPEAHVQAALLALDLHLPGEARALLELGRSAEDADVDRSLCHARVALLEGATEAAFGHLMDAIAADATDPRAYELLGDFHRESGRSAEAEEAYAHAMALTGGEDRPPASLKLFLRLGAALLAEGKLDDARGVYLAACEMCPRASTWLGAAVAMLRGGDLEVPRRRSPRRTSSTRPIRKCGGICASSRSSPSAWTRRRRRWDRRSRRICATRVCWRRLGRSSSSAGDGGTRRARCDAR